MRSSCISTSRSPKLLPFGKCAGASRRGLSSVRAYSAGMLPMARRKMEDYSPRRAWTGGQATEPKEQNTQQSPRLGRSRAWQLLHS